MKMLGTHKPQQQTTLTKNKRKEIPEISFRFRFRNPTERKSQIPEFSFFSLQPFFSVRMVATRTEIEVSFSYQCRGYDPPPSMGKNGRNMDLGPCKK